MKTNPTAAFGIGIAWATLIVAAPASAMPVLFNDRAAFDAATTGLSFESFETPFADTTMPLVFADFTVTETVGVQDFRSLTNLQLVSDGTRALVFFSDPSEVTITFASPIDTFKIDINDFGVTLGTLSIASDTGSFNELLATGPLPQSGGNTVFFGVADPQLFQSIVISTTTGSLDAVALDGLAFGTSQVPTGVPAPQSIALMLLGLAGLASERGAHKQPRRPAGSSLRR